MDYRSFAFLIYKIAEPYLAFQPAGLVAVECFNCETYIDEKKSVYLYFFMPV